MLNNQHLLSPHITKFHAICHLYDLEGAQIPHSRSLFLHDNYRNIKPKSKHIVKYPNLQDAMRSVIASQYLPVPGPPTQMIHTDNGWIDEIGEREAEDVN